VLNGIEAMVEGIGVEGLSAPPAAGVGRAGTSGMRRESIIRRRQGIQHGSSPIEWMEKGASKASMLDYSTFVLL
jgi:hypothetical protein